MRTYGFQDDDIQRNLARLLEERGFSLDKPKALSEAVMKLSDHYLLKQAPTPWKEKWAQAAYLAYFFPLNWARAAAVVEEAKRFGFFDGLNSFVDFGSGLSPLAVKLRRQGLANGLCIDRATEALSLLQDLLNPDIRGLEFQQEWGSWDPLIRKGFDPQQSLAVFSYVLTEIGDLPRWAGEAEALLIVEPSTREDGRQLLHLRKGLIDKGYRIWAPCPHQGPCPLLEQSAKDWCHDRVSFDPPSWFLKLEDHMPVKNRTITYSYLLARKKPNPWDLSKAARLVGDQLKENGKTRQLVCRGPDREFLSWLKKNGPAPEHYRGELIAMDAEFEKKGDELRPKS